MIAGVQATPTSLLCLHGRVEDRRSGVVVGCGSGGGRRLLSDVDSVCLQDPEGPTFPHAW